MSAFKYQQKSCDTLKFTSRVKFATQFQIGESFVVTVGPFSRPLWFAINWASVTPLTRYRLISSAMGKRFRYQSVG